MKAGWEGVRRKRRDEDAGKRKETVAKSWSTLPNQQVGLGTPEIT